LRRPLLVAEGETHMTLLRQLVTRHRGWALVVAPAFARGTVVGSVHLARAGWMGQSLAAALGGGSGTAQSAQSSAPPQQDSGPMVEHAAHADSPGDRD
jgi:hypothetical protein